MKIGIDVRKISDTGIGRYIENLVAHMLLADERNEYILFFAPDDIKNYDYPKERVTKVIETAKKYSIKEHFMLGAKAKEYDIDLFHAPHYVLPLTVKTPSVTTIHDIIHVTDPSINYIRKRYATFMIGQAIRKSKKVLTVSEASKKSIIEVFNTDESKIIVTPNGGGDFTRTPDEKLREKLSALGLTEGYVLFVGSDRPHKNLKAIFEVSKMVGDELSFVVAGRVVDKENFAKASERIQFIDKLDKDEMEAVYSGAMALLFPSYLEGFGLPPLEAMACKTPVVASNRSAIPEVVGDAAILVDPDDYAKMAETLVAVKSDPMFKDSLVIKGLSQVEKFSWEKTAMLTLAAYEQAVGK